MLKFFFLVCVCAGGGEVVCDFLIVDCIGLITALCVGIGMLLLLQIFISAL